MTTVTNSPQETIALGKVFSKKLKGKDVIILTGNLGGGKTTFAKGVLKGLGFKGTVRSPSFSLVRKYESKKISLYHIDLYRLSGKDLFSFGLEDYLYADKAISLIEWGEKIDKLLPNYLKVNFSHLAEFKRKIKISAKGAKHKLNFSLR